MILYTDKYRELCQYLLDKTDTFSAILVKGDYGKGKSTLIKQSLKEISRPSIFVCQYPGMNTPYEALFSALNQFLKIDYYDAKNMNKEISYREYLRQLCIKICKSNMGLIIVFQDIKDYELELSELILQICQELEMKQIYCSFILEYSTDNLLLNQQEVFIKCADICTGHIISLDSKDYVDYIDYFLSFLYGDNKISQSQIEKIITEAFYNPALIKKMIYYFIDVGIFYQNDEYWYCDKMDFHLTARLFENYIVQRYSQLDECLKEILHKACITGFEIDSTLLYHPLGVIKSEENLKRIERLSRLIVQTENNYKFENDTVYNLINNQICLSERKALHLLVAEYLYKKIADYKTSDSLLSLLNIIKIHYLNAGHINEALHVIGNYIQYAHIQRNYDAVLNAVKEFKKLSDDKFPYAEQQMIIKEVEIHQILGEFTKAYVLLNTLKCKYLPLESENWIEYWKASCLFNMGYTNESKEKADLLISKLDSGQLSDEYLYLKLDILLVGMYHHFGNIAYASKRYEQAIAISMGNKFYEKEYNYLLSISNMFLDNELAIRQIGKSIRYFRENNFLVSYAKSTNNIAINYIYLSQYEQAITNLKGSITAFREMCSASCHYPLNNLGTVYGHLGQYNKALLMFMEAQNNPVEPFSHLWISMNIANCKRKLGNIQDCETILNLVENEINHMNCNIYLLQRNLHISKALMYYEKGDYPLAYNNCSQALTLEIDILKNDTYCVYLSKLIKIFSQKTGQPVPKSADKYVTGIEDAFCKNLLESNTHWGNLLFWEM